MSREGCGYAQIGVVLSFDLSRVGCDVTYNSSPSGQIRL